MNAAENEVSANRIYIPGAHCFAGTCRNKAELLVVTECSVFMVCGKCSKGYKSTRNTVFHVYELDKRNGGLVTMKNKRRTR